MHDAQAPVIDPFCRVVGLSKASEQSATGSQSTCATYWIKHASYGHRCEGGR